MGCSGSEHILYQYLDPVDVAVNEGISKKIHVYALLENPKTHQKEKVYLLLKHNAAGQPYFFQDFEKTEDRNHKYERGKKNGRRN